MSPRASPLEMPSRSGLLCSVADPDARSSSRAACTTVVVVASVVLAAIQPVVLPAAKPPDWAMGFAMILLGLAGNWYGSFADWVRSGAGHSAPSPACVSRLLADPLACAHLQVAFAPVSQAALRSRRAAMMSKRSAKLAAGWRVPVVIASEWIELGLAAVRAVRQQLR